MGFDFVNGVAPIATTATTTAGATAADGTAGVTYTTEKLYVSGAAAVISSSILTFKNGLLVSSSLWKGGSAF